MFEADGQRQGAEDFFAGILRASLQLSLAGLLVKSIALGKEFIVAAAYGRSDAMDAFLLAFLLPNLFVNLLAESMNQALIPAYVRMRIQHGKQEARRLLSNSMLLLFVILSCIAAALGASLPLLLPLLAPHFSPQKLGLAIGLGRIMLPVIVLVGMAANGAAVLNALGSFTWPALAQSMIPLAILSAALLFGHSYGIYAIAHAAVAGALLFALLIFLLLGLKGEHPRIHWYRGISGSAEVLRQYLQVLLSALVANAGLLVDQAMAMLFVAGSLSALVYAGKFVSIPMAMLAGVISTAITPHFSRMVAHRKWQSCRATIRQWAWLMAAASSVPALALILFARPILRIAFEHGAFHAADTAAVAPVLMMYALQIPFYVASRVHYRFIIAMRRTEIVLYCGAINLALDVLLNLVLMHFYGLAGIALSTSLWTLFTFLFLAYWARRLLREAESREAVG